MGGGRKGIEQRPLGGEISVKGSGFTRFPVWRDGVFWACGHAGMKRWWDLNAHMADRNSTGECGMERMKREVTVFGRVERSINFLGGGTTFFEGE